MDTEVTGKTQKPTKGQLVKLLGYSYFRVGMVTDGINPDWYNCITYTRYGKSLMLYDWEITSYYIICTNCSKCNDRFECYTMLVSPYIQKHRPLTDS
jgi:hypothetical protein